jgi:hypothetical protein
MPEHCFKKKDSYPPVCGIHNVELRENEIQGETNPPGLGHITCYICPASRDIVLDAEGL